MDWHDLISHYRRIFSTTEGKKVLLHMLAEMRAFDEISDDLGEIALKNYANRLLGILGGETKPSDASVTVFVDALIKQPLKKEGKE